MSDQPDQKQVNLPSDFENAERFKRLFIDPAVEAMGQRVENHLGPVLAGQRKLFARLDAQDDTNKQQDQRLDILEGSQKKALVGWGVFAAGLSIALSASWQYIAKKIGINTGE